MVLHMSEHWKRIPGYPDYEASDLGRIKSRGRWMTHHRHHTPMWWKEKILKPHLSNKGHLYVSICTETFFVHRLVALTWIGPAPFLTAIVRHWDDDKMNNTPRNLRWGTQHDNMMDCLRNGTQLGGYRPAGSHQISPGVFE